MDNRAYQCCHSFILVTEMRQEGSDEGVCHGR
jgi:hypothetical protein